MKLDVKFGDLSPVFQADFSESECSLSPSFGEVIVMVAPPQDVVLYSGEYTVTPKVEAQSLKTANKFMQKDVSIRAIPFYETTNNSGGVTAYIGSEVPYGNQ